MKVSPVTYSSASYNHIKNRVLYVKSPLFGCTTDQTKRTFWAIFLSAVMGVISLSQVKSKEPVSLTSDNIPSFNTVKLPTQAEQDKEPVVKKAFEKNIHISLSLFGDLAPNHDKEAVIHIIPSHSNALQSDKQHIYSNPVWPDVANIRDTFKHALTTLSSDIETLKVVLPSELKSPLEEIIKGLSEETAMHGYNTNLYHQDSSYPYSLNHLIFTGFPETKEIKKAVEAGQTMGHAINFARFLVDMPSNFKTPLEIALQAKNRLSEHKNIQINIRDNNWIHEQRMGLFEAVAAGNNNQESPKLLEMIYTPKDGKYDRTILLVGKGVTFDSGGYNLKSGQQGEVMENMHGDMAGAAAVIGAIENIADMNIPGVRVVGLAPLTPNRIDANATLPHSIATSRSGKTVEIINTDAEGRLIMADTLHYGGEQYRPDLMIDIATLNFLKAMAVGKENAVALISNNPVLNSEVEKIEKMLGRKTGILTLNKAHERWVTKDDKGKANAYNGHSLKDDAAFYEIFGPGITYDKTRPEHYFQSVAGTAAFLDVLRFDRNVPYVHMDMAGAEFTRVKHLNGATFATGFGVKDLAAIVEALSKGELKLK